MKTPLAIVVLYLMVLVHGLIHHLPQHVPDPRVQDWLLMKYWTPIVLIIISYFLLVLVGPKLMQNRKPFELKYPIKLYNLSQVFLCGYMFKEFLASSYQSSYSLTCQPVDYSSSPLAIRIAAASWWFFFSKLIDLLDTVFFILRKKNGQCMLNSYVHVVMYTYYFFSSFGPAIQKYLWWKKYLTQFQLIQFIAIIIHLVNGMARGTCEFPQIFYWYVIVYCVTLIALFTNFYVETYSHVLKDRAAAAKKELTTGAGAVAAAESNNNNDIVSVQEVKKKPMGIIIHRTPYTGLRTNSIGIDRK